MPNRAAHKQRERQRYKRAARRPAHVDKYAGRVGNDKLAALAARFNGEEARDA